MEDEQTSSCYQSDCLVSTPGFYLQPACLFSMHPPANVQHLALQDPGADQVLWEHLAVYEGEQRCVNVAQGKTWSALWADP